RELQEKGVTADIANQAVAKYPYDHQFATALKWVSKEQNKKSKLSYRKRNEQLRIKLMQKGFSKDVVNDVMAELSMGLNKEEEFSNLKLQGDKLYRRYSKKYAGYDLKMKITAGLYHRGFSGELINEYVEKLD